MSGRWSGCLVSLLRLFGETKEEIRGTRFYLLISRPFLQSRIYRWVSTGNDEGAVIRQPVSPRSKSWHQGSTAASILSEDNFYSPFFIASPASSAEAMRKSNITHFIFIKKLRSVLIALAYVSKRRLRHCELRFFQAVQLFFFLGL